MNSASILEKIPNVKIDPNGIFKYIQIYVKNPFSGDSKYVIRGFKKYKFHLDNFNDFQSINIKIMYKF